MSEIEKIQQYIERVPIANRARYDMNMNEVLALSHAAQKDVYSIVASAFRYGQAKGYKAAQGRSRMGDQQKKAVISSEA